MIVQPVRGGGTGSMEDEVEPAGPNLNDLPEFTLIGFEHPVDFQPEWYPERVTVSKERRMSRTPGMCADQKVRDIGAKNREIHVNGYMLDDTKTDFHALLDSGREFVLSCMPWSGRVMLESGEIEGPLGIERGQWVYEYTLDLVSVGNDFTNNGIVSSGRG